jgi:hypothetical protein
MRRLGLRLDFILQLDPVIELRAGEGVEDGLLFGDGRRWLRLLRGGREGEGQQQEGGEREGGASHAASSTRRWRSSSRLHASGTASKGVAGTPLLPMLSSNSAKGSGVKALSRWLSR